MPQIEPLPILLRFVRSQPIARFVSFACAAALAVLFAVRDQVPMAIFFAALAVVNLEDTAAYRKAAAVIEALNRP